MFKSILGRSVLTSEHVQNVTLKCSPVLGHLGSGGDSCKLSESLKAEQTIWRLIVLAETVSEYVIGLLESSVGLLNCILTFKSPLQCNEPVYLCLDRHKHCSLLP